MTREELMESLSYDPNTGVFRWKNTTCKKLKPGDVAGAIDRTKGYRRIGIRGEKHGAHRLAWLYVHGHWPSEHIDHIDGNRDNNAIANLREATNGENLRNRGPQRDNTSGFKGVTWDRERGKWTAQINLRGKHHHLGRFDNKKDAARAYDLAAARLHGEYAYQNDGGR